MGDLLPVMHYIRQNRLEDDIDIVLKSDGSPLVVLNWPTYILLSKKNTSRKLREALQRAMDDMKDDGTFDAIYTKYR